MERAPFLFRRYKQGAALQPGNNVKIGLPQYFFIVASKFAGEGFIMELVAVAICKKKLANQHFRLCVLPLIMLIPK